MRIGFLNTTGGVHDSHILTTGNALFGLGEGLCLRTFVFLHAFLSGNAKALGLQSIWGG